MENQFAAPKQTENTKPIRTLTKFTNSPIYQQIYGLRLTTGLEGFVYYIDDILSQVFLGYETPLPRLFSIPGFTEASARAALDLQDMLIKPIQRYIKRQVERN